MENKIKFIANAVRWCDKVNGNTYHSVNITRVKDGKTIYCPLQYGYGEHYRQTAFEAMIKNGWIKEHYADYPHMYERTQNYPIYWNVTDGLKRDCVKNGNE
jgi:hypothetical protein